MARGPKPTGEYRGQKAVFSSRLTPDLRAELEKACRESGRSFSQEIEHRLRQSFHFDDDVRARFGSRENFFLMLALSYVVNRAAQLAGRKRNQPLTSWLTDPLQFAAVREAVLQQLDAIQPPGPQARLTARQKVLARQAAATTLWHLWRQIQDADWPVPVGAKRGAYLAGRLKKELGEIAMRPKLYVRDRGEKVLWADFKAQRKGRKP